MVLPERPHPITTPLMSSSLLSPLSQVQMRVVRLERLSSAEIKCGLRYSLLWTYFQLLVPLSQAYGFSRGGKKQPITVKSSRKSTVPDVRHLGMGSRSPPTHVVSGFCPHWCWTKPWPLLGHSLEDQRAFFFVSIANLLLFSLLAMSPGKILRTVVVNMVWLI